MTRVDLEIHIENLDWSDILKNMRMALLGNYWNTWMYVLRLKDEHRPVGRCFHKRLYTHVGPTKQNTCRMRHLSLLVSINWWVST